MIFSTRRWLVSALVVLLCASSWWGGFDRMSEAYLDRAMTQAVTAFAIARGINAVLSVAKGSEVSVQPLGVGVTIAVGEVLDPVDDLIERFSWVMLVAIVALGVQQLLLALGGTLAVNLGLSALGAGALLSVWRLTWSGPVLARVLVRAFIVVVVLRFVMVAVALASDVVHAGVVGERVDRETSELTMAESQLTRLSDPTDGSEAPTGADQPWWSSLGSFWEQEGVPAPSDPEVSSWDPRVRLAAMQAAAARTIDHLLSLAAAFITQTVLLPVFFLWLALRVSSELLRDFAGSVGKG